MVTTSKINLGKTNWWSRHNTFHLILHSDLIYCMIFYAYKLCSIFLRYKQGCYCLDLLSLTTFVVIYSCTSYCILLLHKGGIWKSCVLGRVALVLNQRPVECFSLADKPWGCSLLTISKNYISDFFIFGG